MIINKFLYIKNKIINKNNKIILYTLYKVIYTFTKLFHVIANNNNHQISHIINANDIIILIGFNHIKCGNPNDKFNLVFGGKMNLIIINPFLMKTKNNLLCNLLKI